jgi:hypothetical protein
MMHPQTDRSYITVLNIFVLLFTLLHVSGGSVSTSSKARIGVKAGDWMKLNYTYITASNETYPPPGGRSSQWTKIEILEVNTTVPSVEIRMTTHMSDGTDMNQTGTLNFTAGAETEPVLSGLIIPANSGVGDSTYMGSNGIIVITDGTTGTYVGASRSIVHANYSQQWNQVTIHWDMYWDTQTGVVVEDHINSGGINATLRAVETNMWQPQLFAIPVDQTVAYSLIAGAAILTALVFTWRHRKKTPNESPTKKPVKPLPTQAGHSHIP